jgi:hypothetical protein
MPIPRVALAAILSLVAAPLASAAQPNVDPLRFFEGRTETVGTVKVMFHKPYWTRSVGAGRIEDDGSLILVQHVEDEGKAPHERRWHVRRTATNAFVASMSEAVGPVSIDRIGDRYRFRFSVKGNYHAEEILTPLPGGRSARNTLKVKRFGITVATTEGTIRKI